MNTMLESTTEVEAELLRFGLAIAFHAKRPIERGDELTLDYGKEFWAARPWVTPSAGVT